MKEAHFKLISFLGLHILLIGILSLICLVFLDKERRNFSSYIFFSILGFSSLIFGYLLIPLLTLYFRKTKPLYFPKLKVSFPVEETKIEKISLEPLSKSSFGEGGVQAILKIEKISSVLKEQALKILSETKSPYLFGIIKQIFPSLTDEIRIQAYSFLTKMEKFIISRISNLKKLLLISKDTKTLSLIHLDLANSYWDLLLYNLIEESIKGEILNLALFHIKQSISLHPSPEAYFLAGKIYLKIKNFSEAEKYLLSLYSNAYYKSKVIPYLAELYFYNKEFKKVKKLLSELEFALDNRIFFVKELWVD